MQCFEFKGGIGSAPRQLSGANGGFMMGVLVQTNLGTRQLLTINGVPVGRHITDLTPEGPPAKYWGDFGERGSCIVVVATDAPLTNHQCARLAKRSAMGLARVGSLAANSSGELMIAFTIANRVRASEELPNPIEMLNDRRIDPFYQAVIEAREEAVVNALFTANTTVGRDGNTLHAIPIDRTLELLHEYSRLKG